MLPEFKQVTTSEFGYFSRSELHKSNAELSPVRIFPSSSQKILRSPSPSNAIPRLELVSTTNLDNSSRFCGVGSEPRPGKSPFISSLMT